MGSRNLLIAAVLLIAGVFGGGRVLATTTGTVAPSSDPIRIVMQNEGVDQDDPDLAAWSPDDRFILAMSSLGSDQVVLRDATTGIVVNRLTLPGDPDGDQIIVNTLTFGPTDATAIATAFATEDGPHPRCRWVTYAIDLDAMKVTATYTAKGPHDCYPVVPSFARLNGLLATSHHGNLQLVDSLPTVSTGVYVTDAAGNVLHTLQKPVGSSPTLGLRDAAIAADGRTFALIVDRNGGVDPTDAANMTQTNGHVGDRPVQHSTIALYDSTLLQFDAEYHFTGFYTRVRWIDAGTFLLTRDYIADERDVSPSMNDDRSLFEPPPALVVDAGTGKIESSIPMQCYLTALPGGRFIGAGLGNCMAQFGDSARGLLLYAPATGWQPFAPGVAGRGYIDALAVSPDGRRLAAIVQADREGDRWIMVTIDLATGNITARQALTDALFASLVFEPTGRGVIVQTPDRRLLWSPDSGKPPVDLVPPRSLDGGAQPDRIVSERGVIIDALPGNAIARIDRATLARQPDLHFDTVVAAGFVPGKPQFWAASASDGVRFWDTRNWQPMHTIALFGGHHSLAYMPDGRYDTDLSPDSTTFRWLVVDDPERSLGSQTFMRTYYTPRLIERLEQCIMVSGGCAATFQKVPPPLELNRVLPIVAITAIRPGKDPATAQIDVTVRQGHDPHAPNGKVASGFYNLRLFRNGSLVAEYPAARSDAPDPTPAQWMAANALPPGADGVAHARFTVALPTGPGSTRVAFSAYAFNSDRIKSETARKTFVAPPAPMRPRRTFVLAIGIDTYTEPRLTLHYAANDATLIGRQLAALPGQEVHTLTLAGDTRPITKRMILAALDLLSTGDRRIDLATLRAGGIDGSGFVPTTPDDAVIVTFSGHGWADTFGNFYLLPADDDWADTAEFPKPASLLSSSELADALKRVDARDMALVIDACHSGASVDTGGFKPGPMGDPGLGQLAFDKGIRILAAAGRDEVAWEDPSLHQGLLTYALAREAIDNTGFGKADLNNDGRIMLDEWLRYALARLPALSERAQSTAGPGHRIGRFTVISDNQAVSPRPQVPALFDFTRRVSHEPLREQRP